MARRSSHERELAPQGHYEVAMTIFWAASITLGMLPPENKSWNLGMSRPETAGSGKARRSWRSGVVRSGAGTVVSNMIRIDEQRYEKVRSEQELLKMKE